MLVWAELSSQTRRCPCSCLQFCELEKCGTWQLLGAEACELCVYFPTLHTALVALSSQSQDEANRDIRRLFIVTL